MKEKILGLVRQYGPLLARIFIGGLFLMAGFSKLTGFSGTAGFIGSVGLPAPEVLAVFAIIVEIGAGLMLLLGYRVVRAAGLLAIFVVLANTFFHMDFADPMLTKNLAIIGGLLYIMVYGAGPLSMDKRRSSSAPPSTGSVSSM